MRWFDAFSGLVQRWRAWEQRHLAFRSSVPSHEAATPRSKVDGAKRCPEDEEVLSEVSDVPGVFRCEACHGHFLTHGLDPLSEGLQGLDRPVAPKPRPLRYRACPACGRPMARRNYRKVSGILIDTCPEHGTWLDAGEMCAMASFMSEGGESKEADFDASEHAWHSEQRAWAEKWSKEARALRRRMNRF